MENTPQPTDQQEHLLDDFDVTLVRADGGKRLANYIVDLISFYLFIILLLRFLVLAFGPLQLDFDGLTLRFLSVVLYIFFYGAFESITGGKTPGKYLTGTRAVKPDGTRITWDVAFTRSLSRIVPFEPFSALGSPAYPWHDRWAKTYVIDERRSRLPQRRGE
jgi:uncharacterized RDD family membrane protein YckC